MKLLTGTKQELESQAVSFIERHKPKTLAVPGGTSIKGIFHLLQKANLDWKNIHIYLTDERLVPKDHEDSNFKNLQENLTNHIDIPKENLHYIDEKLEDDIDLILLSSGEDGHIASLFPNHPSVENESMSYFKITNSPKPPNERMTLSKNKILRSKSAILVFFGESKRNALENFKNENSTITSCPAKMVKQIEDSLILTDIT